MTGGSDQSAFCADGCVNLRITGQDFDLPVGKLAEFVATLYEAAGKPAPVILERPAKPNLDVIPGVRFSVLGRGVEVKRTGAGWHIDADVIRQFAASLAALADEAESDPDPAEVEALAEMMSDAEPTLRLGGTSASRDLARTALRWMREHEADR
jgi:hypothetical protein